MPNCFECTIQLALVFCSQCNYVLCRFCNIQKHFHSAFQKHFDKDLTLDSSKSDLKEEKEHTISLVCEECEKNQRSLFCSECDERFCKSCFDTFHQKGKRKLHIPEKLPFFDRFNILALIVLFDAKKEENHDLALYLKILTENNFRLENYIIVLTYDLQSAKNMFNFSSKIEFQQVHESFFSSQSDFKEIFTFEPIFSVEAIYRFIFNDFTNEQISQRLNITFPNVKSIDISKCFDVKKYLQKILEKPIIFTKTEKSLKNEPKKIPEFKKTHTNLSFSIKTPIENLYSHKIDRRNNELSSELKYQMFHVQNDFDFSEKTLKSVFLKIQADFIAEALKGNLKFLYDQVLLKLQEKFDVPIFKLASFFDKAVSSDVFYKHKRQFSKNHTLLFVSLKPSFLFSHENLLWVVKSLRNDCLSFTLPMILNRIHDAFDLVLPEEIMYEIFDDYILLKSKSKNEEKISIFRNLEIIKSSSVEYQITYYEDESNTIKFNNFEDKKTIDENEPLFHKFLKNIDHVFENDLICIDVPSKSSRITEFQVLQTCQDSNPLDARISQKDSFCVTNKKFSTRQEISHNSYCDFLETKNAQKSQTLISYSNIKNEQEILPVPIESVCTTFPSEQKDNFITKKKTESINKSKISSKFSNSFDHNVIYSKTDEIKEAQVQPEKITSELIKKGIPGGKYGFAIFLNHFGFQEFRTFSIGKLLSFIDKAIKIEYIHYIKTFLVKNEHFISNQEILQKNKENFEKDELFALFANKLEEILKKNNGQINLAQAKEMLEEHTNKSFSELYKFGINKIGNFIEKFSEKFYVFEPKKGMLVLRLCDNCSLLPKNSIQSAFKEKNIYIKKKDKQIGLGQKKMPIESLKEISYRAGRHSLADEKGRLNSSSIEDYLKKIKLIVVEILLNNKNGIELGRLQKILNEQIPSEFDCITFGYENFYNFLLENLSDFVEVQVRYLNKHEAKYIIHLRNKKFGFSELKKFIAISGSKLRESKECIQSGNMNFNNSSYHNNFSSHGVINKLLQNNDRNSQVLLYEKQLNNVSNEIPKISYKLINSNMISHDDSFLISFKKR